MSLELDHRAYWEIKKLNMEFKQAREKCLLQLNELKEIKDESYENSKIYKQHTKHYHDKGLIYKSLYHRMKILLFNSDFKFFRGNLKTKWCGPSQFV